jgi:hypothetical protein
MPESEMQEWRRRPSWREWAQLEGVDGGNCETVAAWSWTWGKSINGQRQGNSCWAEEADSMEDFQAGVGERLHIIGWEVVRGLDEVVLGEEVCTLPGKIVNARKSG